MVELTAPSSYYKLSKEAKAEICNGCGASGWKIDIVPDTIYGLYIGEACNIHDYMYHIGTTETYKILADNIFYDNMKKLIENKGGLLKWFRLRRAWKYYKAVEKLGSSSYWKDKR